MQTQQHLKSKYRKQNKGVVDSVIYAPSMITRGVCVSILSIGQDLDNIIRQKIQDDYEGKCVVEGYIKPGSSKIVSYSSGTVRGGNIIFEVLFECETCLPVEGMKITCIAVNITKAGIRGDIANIKPSPAIVFITRDHHYNVEYFNTIKEGDTFVAVVIGQRFELNDRFVSIIAKLETSNEYKRTMKYQNRMQQMPQRRTVATVREKSYFDLEESPQDQDQQENIIEDDYLKGFEQTNLPPIALRKKKEQHDHHNATTSAAITTKKAHINMDEDDDIFKHQTNAIAAIQNPEYEEGEDDEEYDEEDEEEDGNDDYVGIETEVKKKARFEDSDSDD